ncbi:hypothetical protein FHR81_005569 [Actinoalloteichus hoggarensis]|uniref:Uncharacterized protein n=1 Tax=Actinoalloteichus hoggarensis TaxID=1470176 RepID=A0A221W4M6_9PSEU|nr:hypothetical protein AHOG_15185 [Actinoalloteichus hoggarensis]MBB5924484.1 hypothetical protein [Actinoalloteichus hoggarensis]
MLSAPNDVLGVGRGIKTSLVVSKPWYRHAVRPPDPASPDSPS